MGRARKLRDTRDLDGILILNKPVGLSSNRALQQVKKIFRARKAGHCGSLDPLASGLLPICLGQATKFSGYLLGANKTYRATCQLGKTTTTADAEGEVLNIHPVDVNLAQIKRVLKDFTGEIEQVPPMYSALKHKGVRLYQLARLGKQVERKPRRVRIFTLQLLSFEDDRLQLDVSCSKGTYIRTLAQDIGTALGCGAYLSALHRSAVEPFDDHDAISIDRLQVLAGQGIARLERLLLPVTAALMQFPELKLEVVDGVEICQGKQVLIGREMNPGLYRLVSEDGRFIGLGEASVNGGLVSKRLMNTEHNCATSR